MHHVIVGGGPAATNALETIRQFEADAQITLVCNEPAHSRMALPYWLCGNIPREHTHTADAAYYERLKVDAKIGVRATAIDTSACTLSLDDGSTLNYDRLLIATGSSPVVPPIEGADLPGVQTMWTLNDAAKALQKVEGVSQPEVVFIGGGFIGFIIVNAMNKRQWKLTVVEREKHVLPRMLDDASAGIVEKWLHSRNVSTHCGVDAKSIREENGKHVVTLDDGAEISADIVVLSTGVKGNFAIAEAAGIETEYGILVNDQMQTSVDGIYAAGDVAQGPALFFKDRQVHAIQPTAVDHGRIAGANMAGHEAHYKGSLLMNVTDVCGLQTASFGDWESNGDVTVIENARDNIYRKLVWDGDKLTGAIFTGNANDVGMLTDLGMVKGILQTQTSLGEWKKFLQQNPFDIRRAFIGAGVPQQLVKTTLLGKPSKPRQYTFGGVQHKADVKPAHADYISGLSAGE